MKNKKYSELNKLKSYQERLDYLYCGYTVGEKDYNNARCVLQSFYQHDPRWKEVKKQVILRDRGCNLGIENFEIVGPVIVHHINPITSQDVLDENFDKLLNMDNLICCSNKTHKMIHYGYDELSVQSEIGPVTRTPNDTCPWK